MLMSSLKLSHLQTHLVTSNFLLILLLNYGVLYDECRDRGRVHILYFVPGAIYYLLIIFLFNFYAFFSMINFYEWALKRYRISFQN